MSSLHFLVPFVEIVVISVMINYLLSFFWNTLHIIPIEWLTGPLDIFWSSDWTQPPMVKAQAVTTIHDISPILFPESMYEDTIGKTQRKRLFWAVKECSAFFCDSHATKKDLLHYYHIDPSRAYVVYPGML